MWRILLPVLVGLAAPTAAETVVAARTLRAQTVLGPDDVALVPDTVPGTARDPAEVLGLETRIAIYQGRPIRATDIGPPAIVDRNQSVVLTYASGPLTIAVEGRALGRGGVGDRIRVMNLGSRTTITGTVAADGTVRVRTDR